MSNIKIFQVGTVNTPLFRGRPEMLVYYVHNFHVGDIKVHNCTCFSVADDITFV